jgi:hypothetical protein
MHKLTLFSFAVLLACSLPASAASECDAVIAATLKVLHGPTHMYMTEIAGFNGGKTISAETIYLDGYIYVKVDRSRKAFSFVVNRTDLA